MNIFKTLAAIFVAILITFQTSTVFAKDKQYKFSVRGYTSEKITDREDFAMLKASQYAIKKGYEFFTVENIRRYKKKPRGSSRYGANNPRKKQMRTEITIHCYDEASVVENALNAANVSWGINEKYTH